MTETVENVLGYLRGPLGRRAQRVWRQVRQPQDAGARRWRRIFLSAGSSIGSRVIAMVCSLLTIPIAMRYLGASQYGVWITLTGAVNMLACLDCGVGIGLQNRVSQLMGRDRLADAPTSIRSALAVLSLFALVLLAVFAAILFGTNLTAGLFTSTGLSRPDQTAVVAIIVGAFLAGLPLSLFSRVALGLQQGWIASAATSAGSFLALVGVSVAAALQLDFPAFVAVSVVPPFAAQLICYVILSRRLSGGLAVFGPVSLSDGLRTVREGVPYVLPQIGGLVLNQGPLVILGTVASPVHAALYGVFTRISLPFQQLQQLFLNQVWPAITEALHRGDTAWLQRTLRRLLRSNLAYSLFTFGGVALAIVLLFPLLTRTSGLRLSPVVVALFSLNVAVFGVTQALAYMANGLSRVRRQNVFAVICVASAVTIMPAATARFGLPGLLVCLMALNGLVAVPLLYRDYRAFLAPVAPSTPARHA